MENTHLQSGFGPCQTETSRHGFKHDLTGCAWAILEMLDPWEKDCPNSELMLAQDTEFISC